MPTTWIRCGFSVRSDPEKHRERAIPDYFLIFGYALDAFARQIANEFAFALAYSYLCYGINLRRGRFGSEAGEILPDLKDSENMSMVFKFRMLSDENDNFVRDLEVPYDMTLRGFHEFLVRILGYEACMTSFFTADGQWERLQEYTLLDMGDPESIPMEDVSLGQLLHHNRERLIYLFDQLNNRALYLELTEAKKPEPTMEYPRVAFEHAPAPDQYDPAANEDDGSIFEQMMDDFGEFEGDDSLDDE